MALKNISLTSVGLIVGGTVFGIAALKGQSVSDTLRLIVAGKNPTGGSQTNPIQVGTTVPDAGSVPATDTGSVGSGGTPSANKAIGRLLAAPYGWSVGAEWTALDQLWTRESGWNNRAKNKSSGAYGIPQALPQSKLPIAGQESGGSSASAQIAWGLQYIKSRYGSPSKAWAHELANSWY
jgi:hypothetical protein